MITIQHKDGRTLNLGDKVIDPETGEEFTVDDIHGRIVHVKRTKNGRNIRSKRMASSLGLIVEGETDTFEERDRRLKMALSLREYWEDM